MPASVGSVVTVAAESGAGTATGVLVAVTIGGVIVLGLCVCGILYLLYKRGGKIKTCLGSHNGLLTVEADINPPYGCKKSD